MKVVLVVFCLVALSACSSRAPIQIRQPPPGNPLLSEVQAEPEVYRNNSVLWGGAVLTVINRETETDIELLAMPLDSSGRPLEGQGSPGRFLARVTGFVDPALYESNDLVTVRGSLQGVVQEEIGERLYDYPVVAVHTLYRWPRRTGTHYYPYGYYPYGRFGFGLGLGYGRRFRHYGGFHFRHGFRHHRY